MTKTVELPMLDHHGISAMVLEAMSKGAKSANHPNDPDKITLTFAKEADAKAFRMAIENHTASVMADKADDAISTALDALSDDYADEEHSIDV